MLVVFTLFLLLQTNKLKLQLIEEQMNGPTITAYRYMLIPPTRCVCCRLVTRCYCVSQMRGHCSSLQRPSAATHRPPQGVLHASGIAFTLLLYCATAAKFVCF